MQFNFSFGQEKQPEVPDQEEAYRQRLYDRYTAERSELNHSALEIGGRYDKAVFLLAGGALALSISFIEKIAPDPSWLSLMFLVLSWLFLLICLVSSLFATSESQNAIQRQIDILDTEYASRTSNDLPETEPAPETNLHAARIRRYDTIAKITLVLGLVCLCAFAVINVVPGYQHANATQSAAKAATAPIIATPSLSAHTQQGAK